MRAIVQDIRVRGPGASRRILIALFVALGLLLAVAAAWLLLRARNPGFLLASYDLAKVEAGVESLRLSDVSVASVVETSLIIVGRQAEEVGAQLVSSVATEVGAVRADERRLRQILVNLLSNAVKFTPRGGCVTVDAASAAGTLTISVTDSGRGIDAGDLERIFEPFVQVGEGGARPASGTGLGLSIARRLAVLHGGRLWAESAGLGRGSALGLAVPLRGP